MKIRDARLTSPFGWREDPLKKTGEMQFHYGVDLVFNDENVYSGLPGTCIASKLGKYGEGNYIQIKSNINGVILYANYFHNEENYIKLKTEVKIDDLIAKMGDTGNTTGKHTHWEIFMYVNQLNKEGSRNFLNNIPYFVRKNRIFFNPFKLISYVYWNGE